MSILPFASATRAECTGSSTVEGWGLGHDGIIFSKSLSAIDLAARHRFLSSLWRTGSHNMLWFTGKGSAQTCDGITRRDFLHAGALAAVGLSLPQLFALQARGAVKEDAD